MKYTKKSWIGGVALAGSAVALMLTCGSGQAQRFHEDDITVTVDGSPVQFSDIGPQQIGGRTMVPVRGVLEKLGADITFTEATQTVKATTATTDIRLRIGARRARINNELVTLDMPAQTIQDRTFVPLRFLGEALGADVRWDSATRTVVITTGGHPVRLHRRLERDPRTERELRIERDRIERDRRIPPYRRRGDDR